MSAEHGVYVELLPDGKIKRDLAGILGEVPLAETKISDEILLFSELIFEPYAAVVDQIRSQARAILMHDDHGGLANMTLFQFKLDTMEDLVSHSGAGKSSAGDSAPRTAGRCGPAG